MKSGDMNLDQEFHIKILRINRPRRAYNILAQVITVGFPRVIRR